MESQFIIHSVIIGGFICVVFALYFIRESLEFLSEEVKSNKFSNIINTKESTVIEALSHLSKKIDQTNAKIDALQATMRTEEKPKSVNVMMPKMKDYSDQTKTKNKNS